MDTIEPTPADLAESDDSDDPSSRPGGPRIAFWASLVVGALLLAFVIVLATSPSGSEGRDEGKAVGKVVPPLQGTDLDGGHYNVDDHRGQWVVVNFFASWCIPCITEYPELQAFAQEHADAKDASVVSVAFDDQPSSIKEFLKGFGGKSDWPIVVGETGQTAVDFGVTGVPESFLVAPDGQVVAKFHGVTQAALDDVIDQATGGTGSTDGAGS